MNGFYHLYVKGQCQHRLMIHFPKFMCLNLQWLKIQFLGRCFLIFIFDRLTNLLNAKILRLKASHITTKINASFAPTYQYQFLVIKLNCNFASVDLWTSNFFLKINPVAHPEGGFGVETTFWN